MTSRKTISSPLRVHPRNPRYFTDESGKAIYLTGSHTWGTIQEFESDHPFNYEAYLDFLKKYNHNFARLWTWESGMTGNCIHGWNEGKLLVQPTIYERTGPGIAFDGKPRFDLNKFNEAFFDRLRARVIAARDHGIYVSVMLFQGWDIDNKGRKLPPGYVWGGHPFNKDNNVNGIDGDPDKTGNGRVHTLEIPAVTALQEAYVRKVIDTVNDLHNVLYEISNESYAESMEWQCHMVDYMHDYEEKKPKQHPVGITRPDYRYKIRGEKMFSQSGDLWETPADWISPGRDARERGYCYACNPPPADGKKVILLDTDHIWGTGGDGVWVWKAFMRGNHTLLMDPYDTGYTYVDYGVKDVGKIAPEWESFRISMGQTRMFAEKMNLAEMVPRPDLVPPLGSKYCLANPGVEYLVYRAPDTKRRMLVDLSDAKGDLLVEWFNPATGVSIDGGTISGGGLGDFTAPFEHDSVLYLKLRAS